MGDEQYIIDLEGADTEGQAMRLTFAPEDDDGWLQQELRREPGSSKLRIRAEEDADDTEGHRALRGRYVRVIAESDDDAEGHAISIHFPSLEEADAFRRRLLATGLIVGSVALGATVGGALAGQAATGPAEAGAASTTAVSGEYASDRGVGIAPAAAAGATAGSGEYASDRGVGIAPAAADDGDAAAPEHQSGPGPVPR